MRFIFLAQVVVMFWSGAVNAVEDLPVPTNVQNVPSKGPNQPSRLNMGEEQLVKKKKGPKTLLGIFDIIPEDMEGLEDLMEKIVKPAVESADGFVETYRVEPIAFGAKKIIARILLKEREGGTQPLEDALEALEEIQRAECAMVSIVS